MTLCPLSGHNKLSATRLVQTVATYGVASSSDGSLTMQAMLPLPAAFVPVLSSKLGNSMPDPQADGNLINFRSQLSLARSSSVIDPNRPSAMPWPSQNEVQNIDHRAPKLLATGHPPCSPCACVA